jgi:histone-lysine N-methyltransferase SETMAR
MSGRLVLKMLTMEHKSQRMAASLENLCHYQDEGESFMESIITGDKTWVYKFTPESKRDSMSWKHLHSSTTKKFKIVPSAKKTMVTVFWDCEGLLLCEFLQPKTATINNIKYCETLEKWGKAIKGKRPVRLTDGVRLLHDGAQLHTSARTVAWLQKQKWEVLRHPPHSPHLAPSVLYLFGPFKNFLSGKRFEDQNALKKTVVQCFTTLG